MNILVKMMAEDEVAELREQFHAIDTDGTGMILASELADILKKKDMKADKADIEQIIKEVDYYGNGKINYSEFLVATMNVQTFLTEEN